MFVYVVNWGGGGMIEWIDWRGLEIIHLLGKGPEEDGKLDKSLYDFLLCLRGGG